MEKEYPFNEENTSAVVEEAVVKYLPAMDAGAFPAWERLQQAKHEYLEGQVVAMAGASLNHNRILSNFIANTGTHLKTKSCTVYPSDLRVYVPSKEAYFYPDASIICGTPVFHDSFQDSVTNPAVVVEILSPATENYDLGKKFFFYLQLPSLREYITIHSTGCQVRINRRQPDNSWRFEELSSINDTLVISSIQYRLPLFELYAGIQFNPPAYAAKEHY